MHRHPNQSPAGGQPDQFTAAFGSRIRVFADGVEPAQAAADGPDRPRQPIELAARLAFAGQAAKLSGPNPADGDKRLLDQAGQQHITTAGIVSQRLTGIVSLFKAFGPPPLQQLAEPAWLNNGQLIGLQVEQRKPEPLTR